MPYSKNPQRVCRKCGEIFHCKTNSVLCDICRQPETRICVICGNEFIYRPSLKFDVRTCSCKCGAALRWGDVEKARGERRPPCANCGAPIVRRNLMYGKRKGKHLFCNKKCYGEWRSKNITGDFHPRYKGGYDGYYGKSWKRQRALARKRDKVCQRCGKTPEQNGKALDVHHRIPFREFGIEREKEAHGLNNLVCYCTNCHTLIEWENLQLQNTQLSLPLFPS